MQPCYECKILIQAYYVTGNQSIPYSDLTTMFLILNQGANFRYDMIEISSWTQSSLSLNYTLQNIFCLQKVLDVDCMY